MQRAVRVCAFKYQFIYQDTKELGVSFDGSLLTEKKFKKETVASLSELSV